MTDRDIRAALDGARDFVAEAVDHLSSDLGEGDPLVVVALRSNR